MIAFHLAVTSPIPLPLFLLDNPDQSKTLNHGPHNLTVDPLGASNSYFWWPHEQADKDPPFVWSETDRISSMQMTLTVQDYYDRDNQTIFSRRESPQ